MEKFKMLNMFQQSQFPLKAGVYNTQSWLFGFPYRFFYDGAMPLWNIAVRMVGTKKIASLPIILN